VFLFFNELIIAPVRYVHPLTLNGFLDVLDIDDAWGKAYQNFVGFEVYLYAVYSVQGPDSP